LNLIWQIEKFGSAFVEQVFEQITGGVAVEVIGERTRSGVEKAYDP
jgi:hypothetical protein